MKHKFINNKNKYKNIFFSSLIVTTSFGAAISCTHHQQQLETNSKIIKPNIYSFQLNNQPTKYKKVLHFNLNNEINRNQINLTDFDVYSEDGNKKFLIDYQNSKIDDQNNITLYLNYDFSNDDQNNNFLIKSNKDGSSILLNRNKSFVNFDLNEDKKYFFNLIKDLSNNKIPTIIESRTSSLILQQSFYISLVNYFNNKNNNENINDNLCIVNIDNSTLEENRLNANSLIENNIIDEIKTIDDINDSNIQKLNILNFTRLFSSPNEYNNYLDLLLNKFKINETKIDFVIPCVNFMEWIQEFERINLQSKLAHVLKYVNRIIVLSEGGNHTNFVIPELVQRFNKFIPDNRENVIQKLKDYQDGSLTNLTNEDIYNFITLKNYEIINDKSDFSFISFVNYDGNIKNSLDIMNDSMWHETTFSTNFVEYANLIDDETEKNNYLNAYQKLFVEVDLNNLNNIFVNGIDEYDPKKKNAVFLGSSLFTPLYGPITSTNYSRLQEFTNMRLAIQNKIKTLLEKFPTSEYNIMFKLHPIFSNKNDINYNIAKNYIKLITNGIIDNPIIINSQIPLETLISNNFHYYQQDKNSEKNIFFRENQTTKPQEWTTFFGLQATTTTIHTTRAFYQSSFNISKEDVAQLIPFSNFPLPSEYTIVRRLDEDINENSNFLEENIVNIKRIYYFYCPSIIFNNEKLKIYDSIKINF
ncbi:MAG: hypothetical protein HDR43_00700 [Mycoplasma sp.]|nr:hypothetical protein [Mycoplasma sp.]